MGNATQKEKESVLQWLEDDERHMEEFRSLRKLNDFIIWHEPPAANKNRKYFLYIKEGVDWLFKVAAVFLLGYFLFFHSSVRIPATEESPVLYQTIHVPAGQRAELILADGTEVWLNAMSTLKFPNRFTGDTREVFLTGEGFLMLRLIRSAHSLCTLVITR